MSKVSIIIPAYNSSLFIEETIASAKAQDIDNVEIIVVDDGSTDNTADMVAAMSGVMLISQTNAGDAAARQTGLKVCTGDYVMFLDHDDLLLPNAARLHLESMTGSQSYDLVFGSNMWFNARGETIGERRHEPRAFSAREVALGTTPSFSQCMYRRSALERIGGFRPEALAAADHDLNLRLLGWEYRGYLHGHMVMKYRQHDAQQTRSPTRLYKMHTDALKRIFGRGGELENAELLEQALAKWDRYYGKFLPSECARMVLKREFGKAGKAAILFGRILPRALPAAASYWMSGRASQPA